MTTPTLDLVPKLISGVAKAVPVGGSELDVTTIISRPMYNRFLKELGDDPATAERTKVYGSFTLVCEHELEFALSFPTGSQKAIWM